MKLKLTRVYVDDQDRAQRFYTGVLEFTMTPTDVTGSTIAQVNDTCGNVIQLTQLRAV
jgi:predicted enzyme related to lactoylglutathione lyase